MAFRRKRLGGGGGVLRSGPPPITNVDPTRIAINRPTPRLWERFGLKTPVGLSSMNLNVQPVTITEPNVQELNQLLYNDTEGTFALNSTYSPVALDPEWQQKWTVNGNPGLYCFRFQAYSWSRNAGQSNWGTWAITTGATTLYFWRFMCAGGFEQTFGSDSGDIVLYIAQSWNIQVDTFVAGWVGEFRANCYGRKIQGGDTLDVGRGVGLNEAKFV